jgi:hypothetical protein
VLRQAADARGVFLGDEVMDYMLTRFSRDLGSLIELLSLLDGYACRPSGASPSPDQIHDGKHLSELKTAMKLTLFDLDHTLLPIDSDYAWGVSPPPSAGRTHRRSSAATTSFMSNTKRHARRARVRAFCDGCHVRAGCY